MDQIVINIEFTTGKKPILGAIAYWVLPKKKIAATIREGIKQQMDNWLLTRDLLPNEEPKTNAH